MESVFSCIKWTLYPLPHKMWGLSEATYVKFWVQSKVFNIVNVLFFFPYRKADITFLPLKIYLTSVTLLNVKKYQTYSLSLQDKMHFTYSDIQDSQMIFASLTFHYTHHVPYPWLILNLLKFSKDAPRGPISKYLVKIFPLPGINTIL